MKTSLGNIKNCKRLAVMGGTFDPIHYGHLVAAETVRDEFDIGQVIFIPTGNPPHKAGGSVSHHEHRYLMTVLAAVSNPYFYVSRIEIDRAGHTYTIDTMRALIKLCRPDAEIYFITGADAIADIFTWKDAEMLLELCRFVAVTRPGYNREKLLEYVEGINGKYMSRLHFLEVPALAISSTDIRERVSLDKTIKYLLPGEVETYIHKHGLYKLKMPGFDRERAKSFLKRELSERRFAHTMGVVAEAGRLAEHYGVSKEQAYVAALLHDCAKDIDDMRRVSPGAPDREEYPGLAHGAVGAEIAESHFGVKDAEILDAIRWHTTGRPGMGLLEKLICVADLIEPGRTASGRFEGDMHMLRELAYSDIDAAMAAVLRCKIDYCVRRGYAVHPCGIEALEYYERKK